MDLHGSKVHLSLIGLSSQGTWLNGTTLFDAKKSPKFKLQTS
jgi:hypothetical protein